MRIHTYRIVSRTRLGYRGAFLLLLAVVDLIVGLFLVYPPKEQASTSAFRWRDAIMPGAAWGAIWITASVVLAVNAFMRQDRVGYACAIAVKVFWAAVAAASAITGKVEGAWLTVAVWGVVAGLTLLESSRPEPVRTRDLTVIDVDPDAEDDG